jgi:hypothetical protein
VAAIEGVFVERTCLDGRPVQAIARHEVLIAAQLTDDELLVIARAAEPTMSWK